MKNKMTVRTYTGLRLWFAQRRERKHIERVSRPVIVLESIKIS